MFDPYINKRLIFESILADRHRSFRSQKYVKTPRKCHNNEDSLPEEPK